MFDIACPILDPDLPSAVSLTPFLEFSEGVFSPIRSLDKSLEPALVIDFDSESESESEFESESDSDFNVAVQAPLRSHPKPVNPMLRKTPREMGGTPAYIKVRRQQERVALEGLEELKCLDFNGSKAEIIIDRICKTHRIELISKIDHDWRAWAEKSDRRKVIILNSHCPDIIEQIDFNSWLSRLEEGSLETQRAITWKKIEKLLFCKSKRLWSNSAFHGAFEQILPLLSDSQLDQILEKARAKDYSPFLDFMARKSHAPLVVKTKAEAEKERVLALAKQNRAKRKVAGASAKPQGAFVVLKGPGALKKLRMAFVAPSMLK